MLGIAVEALVASISVYPELTETTYVVIDLLSVWLYVKLVVPSVAPPSRLVGPT